MSRSYNSRKGKISYNNCCCESCTQKRRRRQSKSNIKRDMIKFHDSMEYRISKRKPWLNFRWKRDLDDIIKMNKIRDSYKSWFWLKGKKNVKGYYHQKSRWCKKDILWVRIVR